ncbi:MAG: transglycosylase SLT domain-containing protein [Actinomycetota bacterium]
MDFKKHLYIPIMLLVLVFLFSSCFAIGETAGRPEPAGDFNEEENEEIEQEPVETITPEEKPIPGEGPEEELEMDTQTQRDYFKKGVDYFEEGRYLQSQFYLERIKDSYHILQDHIFYYLAKGLLMQQKYSLSEEYYSLLLGDHPRSIWAEKAALEYADLYFIRENYSRAEDLYQDFYESYPQSDYAGYCLFQLALCQEKNTKLQEAYHNYSKVWLDYPTNEYAGIAYISLERLTDAHDMEPFVPSADQVFDRALEFFYDYQYHNAISQLNHILENYQISSQLEANVLFRMGMCYYNLRDYGQARDHLLSAYQSSQGTGIGDDALYFLARAETNLGNSGQAVSYYQNLVDQYPQSNLSDDALYRIGRIYFFDDQLDKAIENYNRVVEEYPNGDRLGEVLWELGWIYYSTGGYSRAQEIFANMASSFKSTELEEKGLFWQAKCLANKEQTEQAAELFEKIISLSSYSYYTFVSQKILEDKGIYTEIPPIDRSASPFNPQIDEVLPEVYNPLEGNENNDEVIPPHINKALELLRIEIFGSASAEIEAGQDEMEKDPVSILILSTLFYQSQDYNNSISMLARNQRNLRYGLEGQYKDYYHYLLYPYGYREMVEEYGQKFDVDPLFILAVMRQESRFQPEVSSFAGARGLMQIMPATGQGIAQKLGMDNFHVEQLYNPEKSIMMGASYLRDQLDNFDGNKYYASGAYNGGPGAMAGWISRWGDKDIYEFVENIPYDETRDYVKKVMANYYLYHMLYS